LGIKTLDPLNEKYTSYYDNDDNSTNFNVSHGYSYHNGPVLFIIIYIIGMGLGVRVLFISPIWDQ